jgi:hypothetical protein
VGLGETSIGLPELLNVLSRARIINARKEGLTLSLSGTFRRQSQARIKKLSCESADLDNLTYEMIEPALFTARCFPLLLSTNHPMASFSFCLQCPAKSVKISEILCSNHDTNTPPRKSFDQNCKGCDHTSIHLRANYSPRCIENCGPTRRNPGFALVYPPLEDEKKILLCN